MSENFSWDDGNVIIESVSAVAVYSNPKGHLVIRQEARGNHDEDAFIIIPPSQVGDLIVALQAEVKALAAEAEARNDF
jgi:hypothetical protein